MASLSNTDLFGSDTDSDITIEPEEFTSQKESPKISTVKKTSLVKRRSAVHEISDSEEESEEYFILKGKSKNSGIIKKKLESPKKDTNVHVSNNGKQHIHSTGVNLTKSTKKSKSFTDVKNWLDNVNSYDADDGPSKLYKRNSSKGNDLNNSSIKTGKSPFTKKLESHSLDTPHGLKRKQTLLLEEDKQEPERKKKPVCQYGNKCYRKNPSHFEEFSHSKGLRLVFLNMYFDKDDHTQNSF